MRQVLPGVGEVVSGLRARLVVSGAARHALRRVGVIGSGGRVGCGAGPVLPGEGAVVSGLRAQVVAVAGGRR
jgi:hypothetical protein